MAETSNIEQLRSLAPTCFHSVISEGCIGCWAALALRVCAENEGLLARLEAAEAEKAALRDGFERGRSYGLAAIIKAEAEVVRLRIHADALAAAVNVALAWHDGRATGATKDDELAGCAEALRAYEEARGVEHG